MPRQALYSRLAEYYDRIYWWKDYDREVSFLTEAFRKYHVRGRRILEVACGTGNHTRILTRLGYEVTGVDISEDVLSVARRKVAKGATFVRGDMKNLSEAVDGEYDAVICLFSAISYNSSMADLRKTLTGFRALLKSNGIVVFDTHFTKKDFRDGYRGEDIFDDGKVIGARLSTSTREGDVGVLSFTYLIKDGRKVVVLRNDVHRLGLFDPGDFISVMKEVGFKKAELYRRWTVRRTGRGPPERENIFVGLKR